MTNSKKSIAFIGGLAIFILSVIAFIIAPMLGDGMGRGSVPVVLGKWNGIKIDNGPDSPFIGQYRQLKQYAQNMGQKDPQLAEYLEQQLLYLSFRLAVIQTAMQDEVKRAGYVAPNFMVNKELINFYLDENGSYSDLKYSSTPEAQRATYRKLVENSLTIDRYIEDLFGDGESYGLKTLSKELNFVANMAKKERSLKYVVFNSGIYPVSEIKKYAEEHSDLFTSYNFSLLTYGDEEEAKKVLTTLKNSEAKFEDTVILNTPKILTDDAGKLKNNYRTDINKYFPDNENLKQVLDLKVGELSSVVKTDTGMFAIVRCDAEPTLPDFSNENLIDTVRSYMNQTEKGLIEDYVLGVANRFIQIAKKDGFQKAGEQFKETELKIETSNSFGLNYGNCPFLQPLPTQSIFYKLSHNEGFFKKVFSLKAGDVSEPILAGQDAVVFTLDTEKEVDQYTIDSTKTEYSRQAGSWFSYYHLALVMGLQGANYSLPVAQTSFMNYVLENPKFENTFTLLFNK